MNYALIVLIGAIAILGLTLYSDFGKELPNLFGQEDADLSTEEGTWVMTPTYVPRPPCPPGMIASPDGKGGYECVAGAVAVPVVYAKTKTTGGIGIEP